MTTKVFVDNNLLPSLVRPTREEHIGGGGMTKYSGSWWLFYSTFTTKITKDDYGKPIHFSWQL